MQPLHNSSVSCSLSNFIFLLGSDKSAIFTLL
jgi:hypothetical protein